MPKIKPRSRMIAAVLKRGSTPPTMPQVAESLGRRIAEARTRAGLDQSDLAAVCDVSASSVSLWEKGRVVLSLERCVKIAAALGVNPVWLTFGHAEMGTAEQSTSVSGRMIPLYSSFTSVPPYPPSLGVEEDYWRQRSNQPRAIVTQRPCSPHAVALEIQNSENANKLLPGDLVVFDPSFDPQPDDIVLFLGANRPPMIRQYQRGGVAGILLVASNASWGMESLSEQEFAEYRFRGVLTEQNRGWRTISAYHGRNPT